MTVSIFSITCISQLTSHKHSLFWAVKPQSIWDDFLKEGAESERGMQLVNLLNWKAKGKFTPNLVFLRTSECMTLISYSMHLMWCVTKSQGGPQYIWTLYCMLITDTLPHEKLLLSVPVHMNFHFSHVFFPDDAVSTSFQFLYQEYTSCLSVCFNINLLVEILKRFRRLTIRNWTWNLLSVKTTCYLLFSQLLTYLKIFVLIPIIST